MSFITNNLQLNIFIGISLIAIISTFIIGIFYKSLIASVLKLLCQIIILIILCFVLSLIQSIPYGNIIVWIILILVILNSIGQIFI